MNTGKTTTVAHPDPTGPLQDRPSQSRPLEAGVNPGTTEASDNINFRPGSPRRF